MKQRWFLSRHALDRMNEMGITRAQVVVALDEPEVSWSSFGRRVAAHGDISVVYEERTRLVVTVLWWTQVEYQRAA